MLSQLSPLNPANYPSSWLNIIKGYNNEVAIYSIFHKAVIACKHIGSESNPIFDLIVIHDDDEISRGIQCRTVNSRGVHVRRASGERYPSKTLIVAEKSDGCLFFAAFSDDVDATYHFPNNGHEPFFFTDKDQYARKVIELSRTAVDVSTVDNLRSEQYALEYAQKLALKARGLILKEPPLPVGDIDCFLLEEAVPAQLKSTRALHGTQVYHVGLGGWKNGVFCPYEANCGFKALIVQTACSDRVFLVIPKVVLAKYGFLSSEKSDGKLSIYVPILANKDHWLAPYWNRFDLLLNDDFQPVKDRLDTICDLYSADGLSARVDRGNIKTSIIAVEGKIVKLIQSKTDYFRCMIDTSSGDFRPLTMNDGIDAIWFQRDSGDFYLIPIEALLHRQYITTDLVVGKHMVSIGKDPWFNNFKNNRGTIFSADKPWFDTFDRISDYCIRNGRSAWIDRKINQSLKLFVKQKLILIRRSTTNHYRMAVKVNRKDRPFHIGDAVNFFLFVQDDTNLWIVPRSLLITEGYIGKDLGSGRANITVHIGIAWLRRYHNNLRLLLDS